MVDEATETGSVESVAGEIASRAIDFADLTAGQIMVPRKRIVAIPSNASTDEVRRIVLEHGHMRMPVYHELIDDALGVSGRNLANAAVDLRRLASICRSRASVCRAHTRAVNRYWHARRDPDSRSPLPNYPSAPRWAEYG